MAAGEGERKKRAADRQITKDDDDLNDEVSNEPQEPSRGFQKADEETMKKRRILKVTSTRKRPETTNEDDDDKPKKNPFMNQTIGKSVFGSGFSSSGFGASKNDATVEATSGGGFGFGGGGFNIGTGFKNAANNSQGANSSTASIFGSTFSGGLASTASSASETSAFGSPSANVPAAPEPSVAFPKHVDLTTGEEGERCLLELRAKSFILAEKKEEPKKPVQQVDDNVHSVPPSSSNTTPAARKEEENGTKEKTTEESKDSTGDQQEATKEDSKEESPKKDDAASKDEPESAKKESKVEAKQNGGNNDEKPKADTKSQPKKKKDWRELGKGPLRILKKDNHTRVVHRLEYAEGGAGTKVLINAPLAKESQASRVPDNEQFVRLTTVQPSGEAATYCLKVKTKEEVTNLVNVLETEISQAESLVESS